MNGEHTTETDLTRCHQVLEEGDKFESSILREPSVKFAFQEEKVRKFDGFMEGNAVL